MNLPEYSSFFLFFQHLLGVVFDCWEFSGAAAGDGHHALSRGKLHQRAWSVLDGACGPQGHVCPPRHCWRLQHQKSMIRQSRRCQNQTKSTLWTLTERKYRFIVQMNLPMKRVRAGIFSQLFSILFPITSSCVCFWLISYWIDFHDARHGALVAHEKVHRGNRARLQGHQQRCRAHDFEHRVPCGMYNRHTKHTLVD